MYKYKCVSRYKILLVVGEKVLEIRPQQIITTDIPISNKFLKTVSTLKPIKKAIKEKKKEPEILVTELKVEKIDGSS